MHCKCCDRQLSEKEQQWDERRQTLEDLCFGCLSTCIDIDELAVLAETNETHKDYVKQLQVTAQTKTTKETEDV